jgi:hypothetical protein
MRLLLLTMLIGCIPSHSRTATKAEGRYTVPSPTGDWSRMNPGGADKAWFNNGLGATIYFDSNCLARFEDRPLPDLITHLTFGLAQDAPIREESMTLDGRTALLRVYEGDLDGVPVRVGAVVTKKNRCLYDGLYIAAPGNFDDGWGAFVEVVSGFKTRGP